MTDVEQDCLEETLPSQHDACTPPPSAFHDDSRESTDDEAVFEALASQFRSSVERRRRRCGRPKKMRELWNGPSLDYH